MTIDQLYHAFCHAENKIILMRYMKPHSPETSEAERAFSYLREKTKKAIQVALTHAKDHFDALLPSLNNKSFQEAYRALDVFKEKVKPYLLHLERTETHLSSPKKKIKIQTSTSLALKIKELVDQGYLLSLSFLPQTSALLNAPFLGPKPCPKSILMQLQESTPLLPLPLTHQKKIYLKETSKNPY